MFEVSILDLTYLVFTSYRLIKYIEITPSPFLVRIHYVDIIEFLFLFLFYVLRILQLTSYFSNQVLHNSLEC